MEIIKDRYYKGKYREKLSYMSGLNLPSPTKKYEFINCAFHPRLRETLVRDYKECKFIECSL